MTCREKLKIEHPECINKRYAGGCEGCPHNYGYLPKPDKCRETRCTVCWDREIPEIEPTIDIHKLYNEQWERMAKIVEEATQKRDRSVSIFFNPETGLSLSVYPWPDVEELERMHALGRITTNQFRRAVGLAPIRETDTRTISER